MATIADAADLHRQLDVAIARAGKPGSELLAACNELTAVTAWLESLCDAIDAKLGPSTTLSTLRVLAERLDRADDRLRSLDAVSRLASNPCQGRA